MMELVVPILIRTDEMIADSFTKALPRDKLAKCRQRMLNQDRGTGTLHALSGKARRILKELRKM